MYKDNKEMKSLEIRIRSKGKLTKIQMRLHEIKRKKKSEKAKSKIKGEKNPTNTRLTFCPLEKRRSTKS